MFKDFLMKKMLKAQGMPEEQIDMAVALINNNPDLFKKIAEEIQQLTKGGKDQMAASMEVMTKYRTEVEAAMKGVKK